VKIENTRVAQSVALQHRCAFYSSPKHLTTQLMPMLATAMARGVTVALARPRSWCG
jgi:hypothetical protein